MNMAGKMKMTVGNSILIGRFIARSSAASWRRLRVSAACTLRMRPSEMPSWSAWMIARTNADSGVSTRFIIFVSAFDRLSPMRISPSARARTRRPAGRPCAPSAWRSRRRTRGPPPPRRPGDRARRAARRAGLLASASSGSGRHPGSMKPTIANTMPRSRPLDASTPAGLAKTWPPTKPTKPRIAFEAR